MVANRLHKVLYDEQKIKELISRYFKIEEFYVQDKTIIANKRTYKGLITYIGVATKI